MAVRQRFRATLAGACVRAAFVLALLSACGIHLQAESPDRIDFDLEVRPIFVRKCIACHGGVKQLGGLSLVFREDALAETDSGMPSIIPGEADSSYLIDRVSDLDDDYRMPPAEHGARLTDEEVTTLRRWIDEGADWRLPWAYRKPVKPEPPALQEATGSLWAWNEMDRFVLDRLQEEGLDPSPAHRGEQREQWLRRVSFDLTGLPPTEEERLQFLMDASPGHIARERVVDRLLTSPHFGERWASLWLDLARYADSMGYERDPKRDVWPYRDWVVGAFNDDKPYDEFVLEQLAGDLLPDASISERLATTLHRNTQTNVEGGTDDEEFRVVAVVDRVDATWQSLQGLTMGCARCHDHPYDPISHEDYYRFYGCLNDTQDADLREEFPMVDAPVDPDRWDEASRIDREVAAARRVVYQQGVRLASDTGQWHGLALDRAESTDAAEFDFVRVDESINGSASSGAEIKVSGTLTNSSKYTFSAPALPGTMTALRLDALPLDLLTASHTPEMGFVAARVRLYVDRKGGETEEVFFQTVFSDEPEPFFDAEDSLEENKEGWCAYSRLWRPRWAVFVVDNPLGQTIKLRDGDRLRIEIKHEKALDGQDALALRRLRAAVSFDDAWQKAVAEQDYLAARLQIAELHLKRKEIPSTPVPCLKERPEDLRRAHYTFVRGNWLVKGDAVQPGVPEVFAAAESEDASEPDRLRVAKWIVSADNPLTARVWVNRVWAELFGSGLVETLDEFGATGARPSHPELLDYLATTFVEGDAWRLKPLLRRIVLSSTYGQDARVTPELLEIDPRNRLLARGPRGRLKAEMVRDQALVLSGLFNPDMHGPPVMPPQPEGVWMTIHSAETWETATDENRFRRALYTYWKRTSAYPSLVAFDAPSREQCTPERSSTNTPLQALVTLNDPAYVELAEGFAGRMLEQSGEVAGQIAWACREATGAEQPAECVDELLALYEEALQAADGRDDPEMFAMTLVASAIMNLDASLTK